MAALLFNKERRNEERRPGGRVSKAGKRRPTRNGFQASEDGESAKRTFSGKKLWQFVQFVALAALVGYAAYQSHYIIFRASYFKLQKLTITGNRVIPREQIVMMSGLELGMPVFELDKSVVMRRLYLLPRVERVTISQRGPNEVAIDIVEKKPAARIHIDGEPLEVDGHGAILGKAGKDSEKLPWILGADVLPSGGGTGLRLDPRIEEGLVAWLPLLHNSPLADFTSISFPSQGKVVVMWRDIEFFLADGDVFRRHGPHIKDLLQLESERGQRFQYVDLRFNDIVARFQPVD